MTTTNTTEKLIHTNRTYEPGHRVTLLDYLGAVAVSEASVVDGTRFGLDPTAWTRVRFTVAGETRCEDWQTDRVRARR